MFNILLTALLFLLPIMLLQKDTPYPGLHLGLWVSLWFWGRLHGGLSLLVFIVAAIYASVSRDYVQHPVFHPSIKGGSPVAFLFFLASMVIFCAMGEVPPAYGAYLHLHQGLLDGASVNGFLCALTGPVLFGMVSDAKGPFPALMSLMLTAASALAMIACSSLWPLIFPVGCGLYWLANAGAYVLLPVFLRHYQGILHMRRTALPMCLVLTLLWAIVYVSFALDTAQTQHAASFLTLAVYLIPGAAFFSLLAWKNRMVLLKPSTGNI